MSHSHNRPPPLHTATPAAKRRRTTLTTDIEMTDIDPQTPHLKLQHLPHEALKQIFTHVNPPPQTLSSLRSYYALRTLCTSFRDAFDAHVTCLHLSTITPSLIPEVIPKFSSLTSLLLPVPLTKESLAPHYAIFLKHTSARIKSLTYSTDESSTTLPNLFANALWPTLERLSTTCGALVRALAGYNCAIHTLELLMNDIDEGSFPTFKSLTHLRLLYKDTNVNGGYLVRCLEGCRELQLLELRVHGVSMRQLAFLPMVCRMRKLSLFGCVVEGEGNRMECVANCGELEELQFEWMRGLTGRDLGIVAKGIGNRLKSLKVWNCEDVDDDGLEMVAKWCRIVEVELRFVREQYSARTLLLFGDRVSWGSYAL